MPRAMPSAGLLPLLQSAVCDRDATGIVHNHKWNDTYGFHDRNPALSLLIRNTTLMLQDPKITVANLHRLPDDIQRLWDDRKLLNQTLLKSGKLQKARNIRVGQLVRNSSELETFLVRQLNFSSSDAAEFLNSSIDVYELQLYLLDRTTELSLCTFGELSRCIQMLQSLQDYFSNRQSTSNGLSKNLGAEGDAIQAMDAKVSSRC